MLLADEPQPLGLGSSDTVIDLGESEISFLLSKTSPTLFFQPDQAINTAVHMHISLSFV